MKFSQACGCSVVPLLSRLVLAAAFVTAGYNKLMKDASFTEAQKDILVSYGVEVTEASTARGPMLIVPAAYQTAGGQDEDAAAEAKTALEEQAGAVEQAASEVKKDVEQAAEAVKEDVGDAIQKTKEALSEDVPANPVIPPPAIDETIPTPAADPAKPYRAASMHKITLLCHQAGWPMPNWMALVAALTEFVGGSFLLIGFLSRIWGLGLSIAMGVAFYLVSMKINGVHTTNPFVFAENIPAFSTLYSQLGLFVLAFGVFLTGPGPVSLDRLLFRRRSKPTIQYDEEIVDDTPPSRVTIGSGRTI